MNQITDKKELKRRMDLIGKHLAIFFGDLEFLQLNVEDPMFILVDKIWNIDVIIEWDCELSLFDITIEHSGSGMLIVNRKRTDLLNLLQPVNYDNFNISMKETPPEILSVINKSLIDLYN